MQCGPGARPQWLGKRLVVIKRLRRTWPGGWDECRRLKEREALCAIPPHANITPLYDAFLDSDTKMLYLVLEPMEGNLYQLIKARKGRPLAGGLVASVFRQMVAGVAHIHGAGYFHRDLKPENVLVTTTGLSSYLSCSPSPTGSSSFQKDVVAIIKLCDFGLARALESAPPYTEYVSTRWYRAPGVLLLSSTYSSALDMWALGAIMAEVINLQPLFPGTDTIDQLAKIGDILGDPDYGDGLRRTVPPCDDHELGGGPWPDGILMAASNGFSFRKNPPQDLHALLPIEPHFPALPRSLVQCIQDLLKYDPDARLTSQ